MKRIPCLLLLLSVACTTTAPPPPSPEPYTVEELCGLLQVGDQAISPDGSLVAFVSDEGGKPDLWTVPFAGGVPTRRTSRGETTGHLTFSPDGQWIYGVSDHGGDESFDIFRIRASGGELEWVRNSDQDEESPEPSPDGKLLAYLSDPDEPYHHRLLVMNLETKEARQFVTEGPAVYGITWSPDSRRVALVQTPDDQKGELLLVEIESGEIRRVPPPIAGGILIPASFSPDGTSVLCLARNVAGFLQLVLVEDRIVRFIGPADRDVEEALWHPVTGIHFIRSEGMRGVAYRMAAVDSVPERLDLDSGSITDLELDEGGERLVYGSGDVVRPAEIWSRDEAGRTQPLVRTVEGRLRAGNLAPGEVIRYRGFEGLEIEALLIRPVQESLGSPPPLIVDVHGGPDLQAMVEFMADHQALAAAGFAVLEPNYRGSAGYGKAFLDANNHDWGGKDMQDLIAGIEHLVELGEADPDRVGIMGGSYGGFMTLLSLVKIPDRWMGGVAMYGMADLVLDYEISIDRFGTWYETEMGTPSTEPDLFRDRSAIHFLDRMKAPLLVLQGENDSNVPKAESDQVVGALRNRKHRVEYVVYPEEGHGFVKRENRVDAIRRTVEFFTKEAESRKQ